MMVRYKVLVQGMTIETYNPGEVHMCNVMWGCSNVCVRGGGCLCGGW